MLPRQGKTTRVPVPKTTHPLAFDCVITNKFCIQGQRGETMFLEVECLVHPLKSSQAEESSVA